MSFFHVSSQFWTNLLFIYDVGFSVSNLVVMQVILSLEVMTPTFACGKPRPPSNWEWYVYEYCLI